MKNNLSDLNNTLFEELDRLTDDTGDVDQEKELKRAKMVVDVANTIIDIGRTQLDALKLREAAGLKNKELPALLEDKDSAAHKNINLLEGATVNG